MLLAFFMRFSSLVLVKDKQLPAKTAAQAAKKYKINLDAANPIER